MEYFLKISVTYVTFEKVHDYIATCASARSELVRNTYIPLLFLAVIFGAFRSFSRDHWLQSRTLVKTSSENQTAKFSCDKKTGKVNHL